jgi:hypothetical protein
MPEGINRFKATWGVAVPPEILKEIPEAEYDEWVQQMTNYMETANNEDKLLVQGLNRGTSSRILPEGTLHPIEKNLWQFTKYLARISG